MKRVLKILVWCVLISCNVVAANYTFSHELEMRCRYSHVSTQGYTYDKFYEVFENDGHRTKDAAFELHLAILAASNGHILLSATPKPDYTEPVYEIVVGGGGNKFTELRKSLRTNGKTSMRTNGILSAIEYRAFYIKISEDGLVEFGKEGDPLPIILYNDLNPITVKFFSFSSWHGVEAKFLFDCPKPGNGTDTDNGQPQIPTPGSIVPSETPTSKEVERKLSNSDALKQTLLTGSTAYMPPGQVVDVNISLSITSVSFDTYEDKLTTGIAMVVVWTDDRLAWFPDKFNGTKYLKFRQGQIWSPSLFVFNADDKSILSSKNPELITMSSSGEAFLHFQATIETWCHVDSPSHTTRRWLNDQFHCDILVKAWQPHEKFILHAMDNNDKKIKMFENIDDVVKNEWDVIVAAKILRLSNESFILMDNETSQSDTLAISLLLKRRAIAYNIVFYTPLIVLMTFVLLSFWDKPLQMSRVWVYTGYTVAICAGLCYINDLVPGNAVPTILILYTTVLMGVLIALHVQVLLMTSVAERLCKTVFMQSLVTAKWFRALFCLPVLKTCRIYEMINEGFASQEDDDSGVMVAPRNGTVEEMQPEDTKYGEREELAIALDKLMFCVYSVTFAIMLALHY